MPLATLNWPCAVLPVPLAMLPNPMAVDPTPDAVAVCPTAVDCVPLAVELVPHWNAPPTSSRHGTPTMLGLMLLSPLPAFAASKVPEKVLPVVRKAAYSVGTLKGGDPKV